MSKIELVAPCNFGVEAVLSREIKNLGYEIIRVEDGRVSFMANEEGICRSTCGFTAERVLVKIDELKLSPLKLFERTRGSMVPLDTKRCGIPVSRHLQ